MQSAAENRMSPGAVTRVKYIITVCVQSTIFPKLYAVGSFIRKTSMMLTPTAMTKKNTDMPIRKIDVYENIHVPFILRYS